MFQRWREQRAAKVEDSSPVEEKSPPVTTTPSNDFHSVAYATGEGNGVTQPSLPQRRSIVMSVIRDPIKDIPDSEKTIIGVYNQLQHMWDELAYQTRCMPGMNCKLDTRLELMIAKLDDKVKKIDQNKISVKIGGKEVTFRISLILLIASTFTKAYGFDLFFWIG